jgi:phosphatidylserine decarboxylase
MTIHKEGYSLLIKTILVLGAINAALYFFLPDYVVLNTIVQVISGLLFLIVLQFFRNPVRKTIINPNHVIAPADGKVVVIEEVVETEYFKGPRRQVSIFMSPINVHVNRNPISGIVKFFQYHPGLFLVAWHPKSSTENERTTTVVENENGVEVLFRQIAGALAKRIVWYINEGDKVVQGEDFGFIKFGSRVDIFLPLDAKILVNLGDRPVGGETVIAELV